MIFLMLHVDGFLNCFGSKFEFDSAEGYFEPKINGTRLWILQRDVQNYIQSGHQCRTECKWNSIPLNLNSKIKLMF